MHNIDRPTHYNYFRDYDLALSRYLRSDSLWLKGGLNSFAYVSSNPLDAPDIYGLQSKGGMTQYGNWCGAGWSGGHKGPDIPSNPAGPIDSVDDCCMKHDYCYEAVDKCPKCDKGYFSSEKLSCDRTLVQCLGELRGKAPENWPKPSRPGKLSDDAYIFCQKARNFFNTKLGE